MHTLSDASKSLIKARTSIVFRSSLKGMVLVNLGAFTIIKISDVVSAKKGERLKAAVPTKKQILDLGTGLGQATLQAAGYAAISYGVLYLAGRIRPALLNTYLFKGNLKV